MDWVLILRCIGLRHYNVLTVLDWVLILRCIGLRHYNVLTVLDWLYRDVLDWDIIMCLLYWIECIGLRHYTVLTILDWVLIPYVCNKRWNVLIIVKVTTDESSSLTQHMSHNKAGGYIKNCWHSIWVIAREPQPSLGVGPALQSQVIHQVAWTTD